ncbi:MAG TPA: zinc-ribbon and DUF3426 domain-containing protein [Rhodanobacteraceae bacterium]|nr:zinc-ribbon and DUF3426 domain-containing protein [Rhodanobacteraceae bacterium]
MYAQCPECLTIYELDAATLAQAHATVGCGQCGATFNALPTLTEHLPDESFENLVVHPSSPAPPILMMAVVREEPPQQGLFKPVPIADSDTVVEADTDDEPPASFPSFALHPRHRPAPPRHTWRWVAACVVLALCLGAQLVWAKRKPLTANPATRPWLAQACKLFGCSLPPVRDLARLQLLSRDVRPHPNVPDALLISATVRNNAPFTQPYPIVSITLSDLDENRIAMRRFRPTEYIADPEVRAAGLAPGATAALMFEVKDPGRDAVAFQFGFQ